MSQQLKCGCIFDGKSFIKHCREHATMVLKKRAEKSPFWENANKTRQP
jgi:hypothetical protein